MNQFEKYKNIVLQRGNFTIKDYEEVENNVKKEKKIKIERLNKAIKTKFNSDEIDELIDLLELENV